MPNIFHIPTTPAQLQKALNIQGSIVFNAGVHAAEQAGKQSLTEFVKYNQGIVQKNYVLPDALTGKAVGVSMLGTPVMGNLQIQNGVYDSVNANGSVDQVDYPSNAQPLTIDTVLFVVNQDKNIIKTAIQGRNGTIKEYIAMGDYNVKISGIITDSNGVYPTLAVSSLIQILRAPVALSINSTYLSHVYGIKNLVVQSYDFPQMAGSYSYQAFEINCLSDLPLPISINQTNS